MNEYIITFGNNSKFKDCYYSIFAKQEIEARMEAFNIFGNKWAFIYDNKDKAGVSKFNLRCLNE